MLVARLSSLGRVSRRLQKPARVAASCLQRWGHAAPLSEPSGPTFEELGIRHSLVAKLEARGIVSPAPIQAQAIPVIAARQHVAIQSSTGSGKTLAYALPILQQTLKRPSAPFQTLILVPSRELGQQIVHELHSLLGERDAPKSFIGTCYKGRKASSKDADEVAKAKPAILVTTPRTMRALIMSPRCPTAFKSFHTVVLDEADQLLDVQQRYDTMKQRRKKEKMPAPGREVLQWLSKESDSMFQLVCASATINTSLRSFLQKTFSNVQISTAGDMFRVPAVVSHSFALCVGEMEKIERLGGILKSLPTTARCLVVIDSTARVSAFVGQLAQQGVAVRSMYQPLSADPLDRKQFLADYEREGFVGVATAATLRGVDLPFITHVFLAYTPQTANEYLHMAGRCGRRGNTGYVINVTTDRELISLEKFSKHLQFELAEYIY